MKKLATIIISTFLLSILNPFTVLAAEKAVLEVPDNSMTLQEAVELGLKYSNKVKQIDYDIERSEEVRKQAADNIKYIPIGGGHDPQVSAAFTGLVAVDMGLQMTKKSKELEKDKVTLNVFNKYTNVLAAVKKYELAKLELDKAKRDWQVALLSLDAGVISKSQIKLAEAGNKSAQVSYDLAAKEVEKAYQDLNAIIGRKAQDRPLLIDEVEYVPLEVDNIDFTVVRIMDGNPAIWLAEQQVDLAEIQLDLYNWADPTREPYKAKQIDVDKAELSAVDAKKQMRDGLYSLYQGILQLEDNYKLAEQGLKVSMEEYNLKQLQYEVGMLSKQDYLAAELALSKAENNFNQIIYQHEALKQTFYKPWAAQMETASKDV